MSELDLEIALILVGELVHHISRELLDLLEVRHDFRFELYALQSTIELETESKQNFAILTFALLVTLSTSDCFL